MDTSRLSEETLRNQPSNLPHNKPRPGASPREERMRLLLKYIKHNGPSAQVRADAKRDLFRLLANPTSTCIEELERKWKR
ncbi:MAG: hypothetical protein LKI93_00140 [Bifidobacteriaceae bacterium]|nr:hypothetical protein [Bifidobacteriaceae bacterium]MCI1914129.1 hypothetical protein [Bifidobacteriaceae bacterium]MCI1936384.1 hypothetical protein [Bifidobacteriaceae bacterium]